MNHQKMILLQTFLDAEAEHEDNYVFANVQQSFGELILDRVGEEWMVLSMRGSQMPGDAEYTTDDRILIFYRSGSLLSIREHIMIHEEAGDDPYFTVLDFNFRQSTPASEAKGYKR